MTAYTYSGSFPSSPQTNDTLVINDVEYTYTSKGSWAVTGGGILEGTSVRSTGETGAVKFLREDGDGTSSWQAPPGGETLAQTLTIGNTVTAAGKIQFRDTGIYINSSVDGQLDIVADGEVQIAAPTIDINGAVALNGAITGVTNITATGTITGNGSGLTTLNGSNISSGTVAAARVATLNQNTTGSAATLTTARTIAGVSFNGSANISLNNNAITNGAGYTTSAVAGSSSIVTTGALNSGSITSGFGTIDNGASAITTTGVITGGTVEATTDTAAGDNAAMGYTAAEGLILTGQGSSNDVTIKNDADATVMSIATGTTTATFAGDVVAQKGTLQDGAYTGGLILGANANSTASTNSAAKIGRISSPHYTSAEENIFVIGASSDGTINDIFYGGSAGVLNAATNHKFYTASTDTTTTGTLALTLDNSQNATFAGTVLINSGSTNSLITSAGSSSAAAVANFDDIRIDSSLHAGLQFSGGSTGELQISFGDAGDPNAGRINYQNSTNEMHFYTNGSLAFDLDASQNATFAGAINVNSAASLSSGQSGFAINAADYITEFHSQGATPYGVQIKYTGAAPNGTGNEFLYFGDSSNARLIVRSNGGIANYQANDVNLSDERVKKDITPVASQWETIKNIEIVDFRYKDQPEEDNDLNLGVIAQQVESVDPRFVSNWVDEMSEIPDMKAIYNTDLNFAMMKALQEAITKIEELEARITTLEA